MKRTAKTLLCLLLCAAMVIPGALFVGAEEHVHDSAEEAHTHNEVSVMSEESAPEGQAEITTGTEEDIEDLPCLGAGAPGGKHVLSTNADIVRSEDGTRLVRGEQDQRMYGESCTKNGGSSSRRACKYCYKWFTVTTPDTGEVKGHSFGAVKEIESECDGVTYEVKECTKCGYVEVKTKDGKAPTLEGHTAGKPTTTRPNDCTTDSVTKTECTVCGLVLSCVDNGPQGHSGSWQTTKNANCKQSGEQTFECGRCSFKDTKVIPQTGHIYGTIYTKKPTCEEPGTKIDKCTSCGETRGAETPVDPLGHDWVIKESTACDEKPSRVCKRCGKTEDIDTGSPVNHIWGEEQTKEPTCAEEGYTYRICTRCGAEERTGNITPATGKHEWKTVVTQSPTCGTYGESQEICAVCGERGETTPLDPTGEHTPNADDGDCTTAVLCKVCSLVVVKAETEHNYKYTPVPAPQHQATYYHTKTCKNAGCKVSETEECSGVDDGDCTTPVNCTLCKREIKLGSIHWKSGRYSPVVGEENDYHIELCGHAGCNGTYGEKIAHTYVDGQCTVCGHVDGRDHVPDGKWQSDGEFHWQTCTLCGGKTLLSSHDKTDTDAYDGDCTKAVTCTVCGYEVKPATSHSYTGNWESTPEVHYRVCTNAGCTVREEQKHTPVSDGDCTTPDVCSACGYEVVKGGAAHSWVVAKEGHTETYHKLVCSNDGCEQESTEVHTAGIEATCVDRAECAGCHTPFGNVNPENHVGGTEIKGQKPATEEEEGYTGDICCKSCGAVIEEGKPIDKLPPSHKHEYTILKSDGENHWYECSCGEKKADSVEVHNYGPFEYVDASTHKRVCADCKYEDIERHEHGEDPHDCTKSINCIECGGVVVEATAKEHNFNGRAVGTADGHTVACTNPGCEQTTAVIQHSGGVSSCESGGRCEVCDFEYLKKDPSVHTGGTEVRGQKNATTTEKGYTGDTYCLGCGALIEKGSDIDKLPETHTHEYGAWKSDMTHHWRECSCGNRDGYAEHTYEKGVCTVCAAVDPTYNVLPEILVNTEHSITADFPDGEAEYYDGIELVVDKLTDGNDGYADVKSTVGKQFTEFVPFDISLYSLATGKEVQPKSKLTISIPVPEKWKAAETAVYHFENGTLTAVTASASDDGKHVLFTVDHLSVYVLVNTASKAITPPPTGDASAFAALSAVLIIAAAGIAVTAYDPKKRR